MRRFGFKLVLIGDESVGKTSLLLRYVKNTYSDQYIKTIGADFLIKDLELYDCLFRLIIWDLAGERHWSAVRERYMQGANGCILVFDTSQKHDIKSYLNSWIGEVRALLGDHFPIIIVGNKIDLEPAIDLVETANFVGTLDLPFVATSAKTGNHVDAIFQKIIDQIINSKPELIKKVKK